MIYVQWPANTPHYQLYEFQQFLLMMHRHHHPSLLDHQIAQSINVKRLHIVSFHLWEYVGSCRRRRIVYRLCKTPARHENTNKKALLYWMISFRRILTTNDHKVAMTSHKKSWPMFIRLYKASYSQNSSINKNFILNNLRNLYYLVYNTLPPTLQSIL